MAIVDNRCVALAYAVYDKYEKVRRANVYCNSESVKDEIHRIYQGVLSKNRQLSQEIPGGLKELLELMGEENGN